MSFNLPVLHRPLVAVLITWAGLTATAHATILPSEIAPVPVEQWTVTEGDEFIADTEENLGYLVHKDRGYTVFPIVTGQRKVVRYIGRVYDATTPIKDWTVKVQQKKDDRVTFGKSGRFLRLNTDGGTEETPYGIHSHLYAEKMLAATMRYRSMGCIIVSESMMDTIEAIFKINGDTLHVITVDGIGDELATYPLLQSILASNIQKDL